MLTEEKVFDILKSVGSGGRPLMLAPLMLDPLMSAPLMSTAASTN